MSTVPATTERDIIGELAWSYCKALSDNENLYDRRAHGTRIYSIAVMKTLLPQATSDLVGLFQTRSIKDETKALLNVKVAGEQAAIDAHLDTCKIFINEVLKVIPFPQQEAKLNPSLQNLCVLLTPHERGMEELRAAKDTELAIL